MWQDEALDLILLEADGGLAPEESAHLQGIVAENPALQIERERTRAAWPEVRQLGRAVAMPRDFGEAAVASN